MDNQVDIDNLCEGMKEMFINHALGRQSSNGLYMEEVSNNTSLAMRVRSFIDIALMNEMNNELQNLKEVNPNVWQSYVNSIAKSILESSQMSCTQENLNNMLETCTQELITRFSHHFENFDFSGLTFQGNLFPIDDGSEETKKVPDVTASANLNSLFGSQNFAEIAQNIMPQMPLHVRMQSLNILLSSQISDVISSAHWTNLQKCLLIALCDESYGVFQLGLQMHAKLVQSSIPEATKESFLNLLESLCQHYHAQKSNFKEILFQVPSHFRMIRMCSLLLLIIKDLTLNLPRFGEKRLTDMIENFIHLLTIHASRKTLENACSISPYNIIATLDPDANWFDCFVHSASSRRQLLTKLAQNDTFLCIVVQDTIDWLNNPHLPSADNNLLNDNLQGKITQNVIGFSNFLHGISLISKICSFESGVSLLSVALNKSETIRIQDVAELILCFLNEQQAIEERMEVVFSDSLSKLLVSAALSLMSLKENQTAQLLQIVFDPLVKNSMAPMHHTILLLEMFSKQAQGPQNCFFRFGAHNRKKIAVVSPSSSDTSPVGLSGASKRQGVCKDMKGHERQNSLVKNVTSGSETSTAFCPIKIILSTVIKLLKNRDLRDMAVTAKLLDICARIFCSHEGIAILESSKCQLLSVVVNVHEELTEQSRLNGGYKILVERNCYLLYSSLQNFIIKIGTTPLGSSLLATESLSAVTNCLLQKLQQPETPWECPNWRLFVLFAVELQRCAEILADESVALAKSQTLNLWSSLEFETDSNIEIDEQKQQLMTILSICGSSLQGVMAIVNNENNPENDDGDDDSEDTITEQLSEYRPVSALSLISRRTLTEMSADFRVHETVLVALNILSSQLNCSLYLQAKLQIQDKLVELQLENRVDENCDVVIVDECSLMRHEILEKIFLPGAICSKWEVGSKLHCTYPPPPSNTSNARPQQKSRPRSHAELGKFLQETKNGLHDVNWMKQARKAYKTGYTDDIKSNLFVDLVCQVQKATVGESAAGLRWPSAEQVEQIAVLPEESLGVAATVRYGVHHRLLQPASHNTDNLCLMIRMTKFLFGEQKTFSGFDWFLSTIFLISGGNVERCQNILSILVTLPCIQFVWLRYAEFQGHSFSVFCHLMESLLAQEVPLAFNALQGNGMSWCMLCKGWMRECFWRLLDWREVCNWLALIVLHPADYSMYFCAGILLHSEQMILRLANDSSIWTLITNPPDRLCISELLPHMDKLWKRYHSIVLPHLTISAVH